MQTQKSFASHACLASIALGLAFFASACSSLFGGENGGSGGQGGGGGEPWGTSNATSSGTGGAGGGGTGGGMGTGGSATTSSSSSSSGSAPVCGDLVCDGSESCDTCAADCACAMCWGAGPATAALDSEEQAFLTIINQYRAQNGLSPLAPCISLHRAAQGHAENMRDLNFVDHVAPDGSTPPDRACAACYEYGCDPIFGVGENLAAGNPGAQATFTQWKNSPGHNMNMLGSSYGVIGIGRATGGGQYGVYWATVFGYDTEPSCE